MRWRVVIDNADSMIAPGETRSSIQAGLDCQHPHQYNLEGILGNVENKPNQVYELLTWNYLWGVLSSYAWKWLSKGSQSAFSQKIIAKYWWDKNKVLPLQGKKRGKLAEWSNALDSKSGIPIYGYRGFESLTFRHQEKLKRLLLFLYINVCSSWYFKWPSRNFMRERGLSRFFVGEKLS